MQFGVDYVYVSLKRSNKNDSQKLFTEFFLQQPTLDFYWVLQDTTDFIPYSLKAYFSDFLDQNKRAWHSNKGYMSRLT